MKFGDYLRQIREKNGWTQPEAAARADIEQSYLSKLETGKSYPSEDIFGRLVRAYDMDVAAMANSVFSAELDKLRDVAQVRGVVLARQKNEARFMRSWLIAGLMMVMIGAGALGLAVSIPNDRSVTYQYRSEGVIRDGESPMTFEFLYAGQRGNDNSQLSDRVDYEFKSLHQNRGDHFIEKVDGGYRKFTLFEARENSHPSAISWHFAFGIMFLVGGLACFYIARRWR